ncbi:hypothetical protein DFAR_3150005 [Desulfarculales bacterium]
MTILISEMMRRRLTSLDVILKAPTVWKRSTPPWAPPYVSQGRGKAERFFRIVKPQLLPSFKGDTLRDINEALDCWIKDIYHQRKHLGTGQAPLQRFTSKMEYVRLAHADLENYFRKRATRRVALNHTISLAGRLYEAPAPLIGKQISLLIPQP